MNEMNAWREHKWKWWRRFIEIAKLVSTWSKDRSTKVGAVIVDESDWTLVSVGFNGMPRLVDDGVEERHSRPAKYLYTEHAERNAIFNAARAGRSTLGTTMCLNFDSLPCTDCARAVIQAGIKRLVGEGKPFPGRGAGTDYHLQESLEMLREANVEMWEANDDGSLTKV